MTVYEVLTRVKDAEIKRAKGFADQYIDRLMERHPEAEVSQRLGREACTNAEAITVALEALPIEIAEREI